MGIEGGGAVAVMDRWRISIFNLERNVVISHFQQERLWKMGGDDMEKALVRWCIDLVRIEGTGAADVLISWMDSDCAWRESQTCIHVGGARGRPCNFDSHHVWPCKVVSDRF
jgi:hypothetical protein